MNIRKAKAIDIDAIERYTMIFIPQRKKESRLQAG